MKQETVRTTNLTKKEAIEAMKNGHKVAHHFFEIHEFIKMENGFIIDENDYQLNVEKFWAHRKGEAWESGWSILNLPAHTGEQEQGKELWTPGEWTIQTPFCVGNSEKAFINAHDCICTVHNNNKYSHQEANANLYLIAQAKNMYKALKDLVDGNNFGLGKKAMQLRFDIAADILQKAKPI